MRRRTMVAVLAALAPAVSMHGPVAGDTTRPAPMLTTVQVTAPRRSADRRPPISVAVATSRPVVALTFDDGPDPRWTPSMLEELRRTGSRATFFVTGEHARAHPDLLRAIVAAGSEVANHTDTHPVLDGLDAAAVATEVRGAAAAIGASGVRPAPFFRPPKGRYDRSTLVASGEAGLLPVGWTVCLERWLRRVGPAAGPLAAATSVAPGGILLAHDGGIPDRSATVQALPALLDELAKLGYQVVTLTELLPLGQPIHARPGMDITSRYSPTRLLALH